MLQSIIDYISAFPTDHFIPTLYLNTMILLSFISIYFISNSLSKYTTLSNYQWFWNLKDYLLYKYQSGRLSTKLINLIETIFCNKIFFCRNCNAFWIGFIIYNLISLTTLISSETCLILSLLNYLMQVDQSINEDEE